MFGSSPPPQNEHTEFHPRSPYAYSKAFAHYATVNYREAYDVFACCGILFNHESPRRGETFVTRKISRAAARIKCGLEDKLYLGNLHAQRDWGYAPDYVEAMWLMLQQDEPDDYIIGTGVTHSVEEFVELAFNHVGLDWRQYVAVDPRYFRPSEVDTLQADPRKGRAKLKWRHRVEFEELVRIMVDAELAQLGKPTRRALAMVTGVAEI
jgi:GDPmannose 4,6-dehydratase